MSRQDRLVGARLEAEAREASAHIMLRSRRGKPVYLVYDEDTFLGAPTGALAAAPMAASPSTERPPAHRHQWTRALIVTLVAATTAQLVASRVTHDQGSPSLPTDDHARTAGSRTGPARPRVRRPRVEPSVASPSALLAGRDRPRTRYHRHARRARQAVRSGHPAPRAGSRRQPSTPPPRPVSSTLRSQPAATHAAPTGTRAAHEFGFED
jgi:hypothetical protein